MPPDTDYVVVPPSTSQAIGPKGGAKGDVIEWIMLIPISVVMGAVTPEDGTFPAEIIYMGTVGSSTFIVEQLPSPMFIRRRSRNGPWKVATGAGVEVHLAGALT